MKRVKAIMEKRWDSICNDYDETLYQYLQEKKSVKFFGITILSYWKTIDVEIVPKWAWIQNNTLGSTDWKSKWCGIDLGNGLKF